MEKLFYWNYWCLNFNLSESVHSCRCTYILYFHFTLMSNINTSALYILQKQSKGEARHSLFIWMWVAMSIPIIMVYVFTKKKKKKIWNVKWFLYSHKSNEYQKKISINFEHKIFCAILGYA